MGVKLDTKEFIRRSRKVHGSKYGYTKARYVGSLQSITITCKTHGDFQQPASAHMRGSGCLRCARATTAKDTPDDFFRKAKAIHGNRYSYGKSVYVDSKTYITITCKLHGDFTQKPRYHIDPGYLGTGGHCPVCARTLQTKALVASRAMTTKEFIRRSQAKYGHLYDYSQVVYVRSRDKVAIRCKLHGVFQQTPNTHLARRSGGCPVCSHTPTRNYSNVAIRWIEEESEDRRMKDVQHAEAGGEFVIPGTRIRVDGYHARTRTVFEFYGDCWHGNPKRYKPMDRPNPYSTLTAKQLYTRTIKREAELRALGYRVISIWESEYLG